MESVERWRRAGFYASVTALLVGLAALAATASAVQPNYLRTSAVAFVCSVAILSALTLFWFWVLKLRGK